MSISKLCWFNKLELFKAVNRYNHWSVFVMLKLNLSFAQVTLNVHFKDAAKITKYKLSLV